MREREKFRNFHIIHLELTFLLLLRSMTLRTCNKLLNFLISHLPSFFPSLKALTVFVVHVESARGTFLVHGARNNKHANSTNTNNTTSSSTTSTSTEGPSSDKLRAILDELPDDDDGVSVTDKNH